MATAFSQRPFFHTFVDELLLEEPHGRVDVGAPPALVVEEEGQLDVLHGLLPFLAEFEEPDADVFGVELHDLVEPHVMDCQEGGAQGTGLVFEDADDDNLAFRNS